MQAVGGLDAHEPGEGGEEVAQGRRQGPLHPLHPQDPAHGPAQPAQGAVEQGDQPEGGDEHGGHVQGQPQAVQGAVGRRLHHVVGGALHPDRGLSQGGGGLHLRLHHLGGHERRRGGDHRGGQQVGGVDPQAHEGGQHGAGDGGEAAHHEGHQLRAGHGGHVGAHHEGGLGLADEDVGRRRQALGARGAQAAAHDPGEGPHHRLHQAEVVEHAHQGGEEDDGGQDLEGEEVVLEGVAEDEAGAEIDVAEKGGEEPAGQGEQGLARTGLEDEQGEEELQTNAGPHQTQVHAAAVSAQGEGQTDHHQEPEEADQPFHGHQAQRRPSWTSRGSPRPDCTAPSKLKSRPALEGSR